VVSSKHFAKIPPNCTGCTILEPLNDDNALTSGYVPLPNVHKVQFFRIDPRSKSAVRKFSPIGSRHGVTGKELHGPSLGGSN
jgi:hypothetical protein